MTQNTRKTICIPINNYLNYLNLFGKSLIHFNDIRILFCGNNLNDKTKREISLSFESCQVDFFSLSENIQNNSLFFNFYNICIIKDFESKFYLIPFLIKNVYGNGIVLLLSSEITKQKNKISYKLKPFSKRFFNHLNTKAEMLSVVKFDESVLENFGEHHPIDERLLSKIEYENLYPITHCQTQDQEIALKTLIKSFESAYSTSSSEKSVQSSVTIIEGLTGRGKVTSLSLGVASAMKFGLGDIYIVGPHNASLKSFCNNLKRFLVFVDFKESSIHVRQQDKYFVLEVSTENVTHKVRFIDFNHQFTKYDTGLICILEVGLLPIEKINKFLSYNPKLVWATVNTGGFNSTGSDTFHRVCRSFKSFCGVAEIPINEMNITTHKSGAVVRDVTSKTDKRKFTLIFLNNPISYSSQDGLESSLNDIFCLQRKTEPRTNETNGSNFLPEPSLCELMYVDKTTLFSGHAAAEILLERFMNVYTSFDHQRDNQFLQSLADDSAHHLFCLQQPSTSGKYVPEILCIVHIVIEERLGSNVTSIKRDLDSKTSLCPLKEANGVRIEWLITNPKFKKRGYGSHMLKMLHRYFQQDHAPFSTAHVLDSRIVIHNNTELNPISEMSKLLVDISDLPPPSFATDYIVSRFAASFELLTFWKKCDYYTVRVEADAESQMMCTVMRDCSKLVDKLDVAAYQEMCETIGPVILHDLRHIDVTLAHEVLFHRNKYHMTGFKECSLDDISFCLDNRQLKKLDSFVQNMHSFQSVQDIIYHIACIYFGRQMTGLHLPKYQELTLVGFGLQLKSAKHLATEMVLLEKYQTTNIVDPFSLRKDVQNRIPQLLSHIRECARVFLNHVTKIIDEHNQNGVPEKKRRLV